MSRFETGEENAERFVATVADLASEERLVYLTLRSGFDRTKTGWVWMRNRDWRDRVQDLLKAEQIPVKFPTFYKPDHLDDWTFSAQSTCPNHKVETLALADSLMGPVPASAVERFMERFKPYGLWAVWSITVAAAIVAILYMGTHS